MVKLNFVPALCPNPLFTYIVTHGNNMHGKPSQRPKAASFKKRAGLSRGTENREEVGEKGPASGVSRRRRE